MIITKIVQILAALLLLAEVIVRFVYFLQLGSLPNYIMTFYFIIIAFYLLSFEFGIKRVKLKFYLMNFAWGKAIMDFFLGSMIISAYVVPPIDIPATIFFFSATILLIIISIVFRKEEKQRIDAELAVLQKYREAELARKEKEAEEDRNRV